MCGLKFTNRLVGHHAELRKLFQGDSASGTYRALWIFPVFTWFCHLKGKVGATMVTERLGLKTKMPEISVADIVMFTPLSRKRPM